MKTDIPKIDRLKLWETMIALPDIIEQLTPVERIVLRAVLDDKLKRLDKEIERDTEWTEFKAWKDDLHKGSFPERMEKLKALQHRGRGDKEGKRDLVQTFRDLQITIEVHHLHKEGITVIDACNRVAEITGLDADYIKRDIYYKQRQFRGVLNRR